jgi:hypothetical protein
MLAHQKTNFPFLRTVFSFQAMLLVLLMALVWILAAHNGNDPDIWWHLRYADDLAQTHQPAHFDTYSFTVAGRERANHEWLSPVLFYIGWRINGTLGVELVRLMLVESIIIGLLYLSYLSSGNFKAAIFASGFCAFLASVSFGPRMILLGYGCMIVLLIILERFRQNRPGPLWLLPPLFCLWANMHGSWLLGLMVFGIVGAAGLVGGKWGRIESKQWTPRQLRQLIAAGAASVGALLINPFGWKLLAYSIQYRSKMKLPLEHITEYTSVNFHERTGVIALFLVIGLLLVMLFDNRSWRLSDAGLLFLAIYLGFTYVRFLFLVAIVSAPVLARLLDFIPPYDREADKPILNVLMMGFVAAFAIKSFPLPTHAAFEEALAKDYPVEIVPYLRSHPPTGHVLNYFAWGGYLIWYFPEWKVFIDSRVDIFEEAGVFADYLRVLGIEDPQRILDKYKIQYVLFPKDEKLTYVLEHDPRWKVDYRDNLSVLFERNAP